MNGVKEQKKQVRETAIIKGFSHTVSREVTFKDFAGLAHRRGWTRGHTMREHSPRLCKGIDIGRPVPSVAVCRQRLGRQHVLCH